MRHVRPANRIGMFNVSNSRATPFAPIQTAWLVASAICLVCPNALAQSDPAPDVQDQDYVAVGTTAYRKGKYVAAKAAFDTAWNFNHSGAIGAMLAEVEMKLGRFDLAAYHWTYATQNLPEGSGARKQAVEGLAACKVKVGTLRIQLTPPDASLTIDETAVEYEEVEGKRQTWVLPGTHVANASQAPSGAAEPVTFVIQAGETRELVLSVPMPVVAAPREKVPFVVPPPSPFRPEPIQDVTLRRPVAVLVVGGAVTATALGVGTWFGLRRSSNQDRIKELQSELDRIEGTSSASRSACSTSENAARSQCGSLQMEIRNYNHNTDYANIAFVVAAGAGLASLAAYFLWPSSTEQAVGQRVSTSKVTVAPWLSSSLNGLDVHMRF